MLSVVLRTLTMLRDKCLFVYGFGHEISDVGGLGWGGLTE